MKQIIITLASLAAFLILLGCKEKGCTDPLALNFNPNAEKNEGCVYPNFTLYLTADVATQFMNDGVIGFILKTQNNPPSNTPTALLHVNKFIDIHDYTSSVPDCGGGVWSYYEADGVYYYSCLELQAVTNSDTTWTQFIAPSFANGNSGNDMCMKMPIYYP